MKCHNDDCDGAHLTARGNAGAAVRARRVEKAAAAAASGAPAASGRAAKSVIGSLAESALSAPVDVGIKAAEEIRGAPDDRSVFAGLGELLGPSVRLSSRVLKRQSLFSMGDLRNDRSSKEAVAFLRKTFEGVAAQAADSTEAGQLLLQRTVKDISSRAHLAEVSAITALADRYIRCSDPLRAREPLAMLLNATKARGLFELLTDAKVRALGDVAFMEHAKPRFYYASRASAASVQVLDGAQATSVAGGDDGDDGELMLDAELASLDELEHATTAVSSSSAGVASATPSSAASSTTTSSTSAKRVCRSLKVEVSVPHQLELQIKRALSKARQVRALVDYEVLMKGIELSPIWSRPRVRVESLQNGMLFLESISLGWKGGVTHLAAVGDCKVFDVPVLNMTIQKGEAWKKYLELSEQDERGYVYDSPRLGRESFNTLYDGISKLAEEKHALSYYFTDMLMAHQNLLAMLVRMEDLWKDHHDPGAHPETFEDFSALPFTFTSLKDAIQKNLAHAKYDLRAHLKLTDCDGDLLHCARFAVGGSCTNSANHCRGQCAECDNFTRLGAAVRMVMNAVANSLGREKPADGVYARDCKTGPVGELLSMGSAITWCERIINLYQRHVVRGVVTAAAAEEAAKVPYGSVLVNMDHKQKIEPQNFNESSEEYYGKKGLSLLGFMVRWRDTEDGPVRTHYVDAVSSNSKQDGTQVQVILTKVVRVIKELAPMAAKFTLLSDNGAAFTASAHMAFAVSQNSKRWDADIVLERWLFFEAQTGKTALDTHFAFVGMLVYRYARKVAAVRSHLDVFKALCDGDGIANSSALLIDFGTGDDDKETPDATGVDAGKVTGVRKIHEIVFLEKSVKTAHYSGFPAGSQTVLIGAPSTLPTSTLVERFTSTKTGRAKPSTVRAPSAGPSIKVSASSTSKVRPHHVRTSEVMVDFCTQSAGAPTTRLLPAQIASTSTSTGSRAAPSSSSKKKKGKPLVEDYVPTFNAGWADAENRTPLTMSGALDGALSDMVCLIGRSFAPLD
jgi:hypothetical protein